MPGLSISVMESDEEFPEEEVLKKIETTVKMKPITCFFKSPKGPTSQKHSQDSPTVKSMSVSSTPANNEVGGLVGLVPSEVDREKYPKANKQINPNRNRVAAKQKGENTSQQNGSNGHCTSSNATRKNKSKLSSKTNMTNKGTDDSQDAVMNSASEDVGQASTISYADFLLSAGLDGQEIKETDDEICLSEVAEDAAVAEVIYEDFLKSGEIEDAETVTDDTSEETDKSGIVEDTSATIDDETEEMSCENDLDDSVSKQEEDQGNLLNSKMETTDHEGSPVDCENDSSTEKIEKPKCHSITKFFSKVDKLPESKFVKPEFTHMTIKVDVHPDPFLSKSPPLTPNFKRKNINEKLEFGSISPEFCAKSGKGLPGAGRNRWKSNVVINDKDIDLSITQLESVDILPQRRSEVVSSKKLDLSCKADCSTTSVSDVRSQGEENSGNGDSDVVIEKVEMIQKTEDDLVVEQERRKILSDQLACLDKVSMTLGGKKSQATLNFGSGKLVAVKAVKSVNTRPRKVSGSQSAEDVDEMQIVSPRRRKGGRGRAGKVKNKSGEEESTEDHNSGSDILEDVSSPQSKRNRRVIRDDSDEEPSPVKNRKKPGPKKSSDLTLSVKNPLKRVHRKEDRDSCNKSEKEAVQLTCRKSPRAGNKKNDVQVIQAAIMPGKSKEKRDRQTIPIRSRFTKMKSVSSTNSEEDFTRSPQLAQARAERNAKVTKAQELLMKARTSKIATKTLKPGKKKSKAIKSKQIKQGADKMSAKGGVVAGRGRKSRKDMSPKVPDSSPPLRRSSRSCAAAARSAISECVETETHKRPKHLHADKPETEVIQVSDPSDSELHKMDTPKKGKKPGIKSPRRTPNKKAPAKKKGTIAPIFMKKSSAGNTDPITVSDDSSDDVVVLPPVDPEIQKIRRDFLMSGVPDTMKKQIVATTNITLSDFPPFPSVSHIQQMSLDSGPPGSVENRTGSSGEENNMEVELGFVGGTAACMCNPWCLSAVELPIKSNLEEMNGLSVDCTKTLQLGQITCCKTPEVGCAINKERTLPALSKEVTKFLLGEVHMHNPAYPVRRVYKQLLSRRHKAEGTSEDQQDSNKTSTAAVSTLLLSKKRKLEDDEKEEEFTRGKRSKRRKELAVGDPDSNQTERRCSLRRRSSRRSLDLGSAEQNTDDGKLGSTADHLLKNTPVVAPKEKSEPVKREVQWTEKYQPTQSSEMLGNSGAVKKMKSWLTEWKHQTNIEIRRMKKQLLKEARRTGKSKEEIKKTLASVRFSPSMAVKPQHMSWTNTTELGGDWWTDDESDFEFDSSDEDSEDQADQEDSLNNTMLVTGPHGIGKTAMVYALAQELGYKVFEVNASSRRNGKHVLAQLQEATQSHQVAKTNLDAMYTTFMATSDAKISPTGVKPEAKKMPAAFANFFQKGSSPTLDDKKGKIRNSKKGNSPAKSKQEEKSAKDKGKRKRRSKHEDDVLITKHETPKKNQKQISLFGKQVAPPGGPPTPSTPGGSRKGLNLTSTSLILFEEVDVVFEEDKGFWAAIQTFASSTKRPIILTTSSARVASFLDIKYDEVKLKRVAPENVASYLQLLCLVEDLRLKHSDILSLVNILQGDLRRTMLSLQYWAQSNGGLHLTENEPIRHLAKFFEKKEEVSAGNVLAPASKTIPVAKPLGIDIVETSRDSGDEFEHFKPRVRRRHAPVIEDDSSQDTLCGTPKKIALTRKSRLAVIDESSQSASEGFNKPLFDKSAEVVLSSMTAPPIHQLCCSSLAGITGPLHGRDIMKILQECDVDCCLRVVQDYSDQGYDLLYNNLPQLMPLPVVETGLPRQPIIPPAISEGDFGQKKLRRIRNNCDLFDSEGDDSCDGFLTLPRKSEHVTKASVEAGAGIGQKVSTALERKPWTLQDTLMADSISALSQMYDSVSFVDSHLQFPEVHREGSCGKNHEYHWCNGNVVPNLTDEPVSCEENKWWLKQCCKDMTANVQVGSLQHCKKHLISVMSRIAQVDPDKQSETRTQLSLPVEDMCDRLKVSAERKLQQRLGGCYRKAASNAADCLPASVGRDAVVTDYLPSLRAICRAEQFREAAKIKRRFFHYLDQIHLPLRQSTIDTLCSSFS